MCIYLLRNDKDDDEDVMFTILFHKKLLILSHLVFSFNKAFLLVSSHLLHEVITRRSHRHLRLERDVVGPQ